MTANQKIVTMHRLKWVGYGSSNLTLNPDSEGPSSFLCRPLKKIMAFFVSQFSKVSKTLGSGHSAAAIDRQYPTQGVSDAEN